MTWIAVLGVAALARAAEANVGTPLMWAGFAHLVLGNAIIGWFEGLLVAGLWKIRRGRTIALLVAANYVSAWVGACALSASSIRTDLGNAWIVLWSMVGVAYLLTILLELPFVAFAFRGQERWIRKSAVASVVAQSASYLVLVAFYASASGVSVLTEAGQVTLAELLPAQNVVFYYVAAEDGAVRRATFANPGGDDAFGIRSIGKDDRLFVQPRAAEPGRWDLALFGRGGIVTLPESFDGGDVAIGWHEPDRQAELRFDFGAARRFGTVDHGRWTCRTGFWPIEGLRCEAPGSESIHLAFATPFGSWAVRSATELPGGQFLFQLGSDQIVLFDPERKLLAPVARGRGVVAVSRHP